jgi:excisionase family DNA binding protein
MPTEPLRATEAARRLGVTTRDVLMLVRDQQIRYVMIDGIAHIPVDAIEEYLQARAS